MGCANLTSVVIPDSVSVIREDAFNGTGLTEIIIPNSVKRIEYGAFANCENLTSVDLGSVDSIYSVDYTYQIHGAFQNCKRLKSIFIPASVNYIEEGAFAGCTELTSIIVAEGNNRYDSRDNCNAVIEKANARICIDGVWYDCNKSKEENCLCVGCAATIIPDSVPWIGSCAFYFCDSLTSIEIPNTVTKIDDKAFRGCKSLTSIVIPESVTVIGVNAFSACDGLKSASVLGPVKELNCTFTRCDSLETATLGAGIKKMDSTFCSCPSLKAIYVPAKKGAYYKKRLIDELIGESKDHLVVELPAEKK